MKLIYSLGVVILCLFFFGCTTQSQQSQPAINSEQQAYAFPQTTPNNEQCQGSSDNYCQGNTRFFDPECRSSRWIFRSEFCEYGCEYGACRTQSCPSTCEDGNPCTTDLCNSGTSYTCQHQPLNGPQPGCQGSSSSCQNYVCEYGTCVTKPQIPCCGNQICETGETQQTCAGDCKAKLDAQIIGCSQGFDITHGLGAVTNIFFTVRNIGQGDTVGIQAVASSTREGNLHPNRAVSIGTVPFGYEVTQKLTVDTAINDYGTITVDVVDTYGNRAQKGTNDCSQIDEKTISNLGQVIKIAGMLGV